MQESTESPQVPSSRKVSRVAGSLALAILFVMLFVYAFSSGMGGMDHEVAAEPAESAAEPAVTEDGHGEDAMSGEPAAAGAEPAAVTADETAAHGDEMVMADGSTMEMDEHSEGVVAETGSQVPADLEESSPALIEGSEGALAAEAGTHAEEAVGDDHETMGGGTVNWYVIGAFLALTAASVSLVAAVKEHLARHIALGTFAAEGAVSE